MRSGDRIREQAIEAYQVLASPPRPELEALVELAARITDTPRASLNLLTATRPRPVATYGPELGDVRFYVAVPLESPAGVVLGTLCVVDRVPHPVGPEIGSALTTLAARVVDVLELELTSRRLAAADERLGAFAAQVGHDLKNPLSAIRLSVELARDEVVEGSELAGLLDRAERGAERMNAMIDELLELARGGTELR